MPCTGRSANRHTSSSANDPLPMNGAEPNVLIIAGAEAVQSGAAPVLRDIAERTNIGVLNTWAAKGLFPWDHPAHLGTIGLQVGDLDLAGIANFDDVVLCGVSEDEIPRRSLAAIGATW